MTGSVSHLSFGCRSSEETKGPASLHIGATGSIKMTYVAAHPNPPESAFPGFPAQALLLIRKVTEVKRPSHHLKPYGGNHCVGNTPVPNKSCTLSTLFGLYFFACSSSDDDAWRGISKYASDPTMGNIQQQQRETQNIIPCWWDIPQILNKFFWQTFFCSSKVPGALL